MEYDILLLLFSQIQIHFHLVNLHLIKLSLAILLKYFPTATVDAIIYPGDNRKKNPLENAIGSERLDVIEADICKNTFMKNYDLCCVLLTLGEAQKFGNSFEDLFHHELS